MSMGSWSTADQVLAYGYDVQGEILKLRLSGSRPTRAQRRDVVLSMAEPSRPTAIATSPPTGPVYALFRVRYLFADPP